MSKPSPPPAPNYQAAAQAQGQASVDAAKTTGQINNPNVVGPYGTQTVSYPNAKPDTTQANFDPQAYLAANPDVAQAGIDPYQHWQNYGQKEGRAFTYNASASPDANTPTLTQTLSPAQQGILDQSQKNQGLIGGLETQGINAAQGIIGAPVDFSGAPTLGNYDSTRQKVIDAMMSRANEDYTKQTAQNNSDLIAAGIHPGTTAYDNAQQMIERSHNDARQQAEIAGGNAASQAFGVDQAARQQAITELLARRSVPLNEISALASGSQVSNPFSTPGYSASANVAPAPLYQATSDLGGYNTDLYNAKAAQQGQLMSGLFGLGAAGTYGLASKSDRRLKSNIVRLGTHPLGIGIYDYDLDGRRERGVMADEVLRVRPDAVLTHPDGYLMVRYDLIGGRP